MLARCRYAADRAARIGSKNVMIHPGVHNINTSIVLGPEHSDITFTGTPGQTVISGGVELRVHWKPYKTDGADNIYVTNVGDQVETVPGLQVNGVRATRARSSQLCCERHLILSLCV